jgi:hypothetical protein
MKRSTQPAEAEITTTASDPAGSGEKHAGEQAEWSRRKFLGSGVGLGAAGLLPGLTTGASAANPPVDITFLLIGDPHYRAFDTTSSNFNLIVRSNLQKMMALTPSSAMPGAGTLGTPVGVINVGDLIEGGSETDPTTGLSLGTTATCELQWANYIRENGLLGNEADSIVKYPIYESYGNHDQNGFLKQVCDRIAARAAVGSGLPNVTARSGSFTYVNAYSNITVTGVHFAWKWGPFHFINTNMRVGNDSKRYPSGGSYAFLESYLENTVGTSGDPVFVTVHLPPSTGAENDWPLADRQAFYDLIIQYNTVGILNGHTHGYGYTQWRGPNGNGAVPITVYQVDAIHHSGNTQGIFTAFRIIEKPGDPTKATIYTSQRIRNNTWGLSTSREITLSYNPDINPDPDPDPPSGLSVLQWQSVNSHGGTSYGLPIETGSTFVEPRQPGIRRIEVLFAEPIAVSNLATAVTITGLRSTGAVTLAGLGITAQVAISGGTSLVITFTSGGNPTGLPDVSKWRFTLNPAVITGTGGAVLTASSATTRIFSGLAGDFDGNGRVTGRDLNSITNTTAFDPAIVDCLRADIDCDGVIGSSDVSTAWANRSNRTDTLGTPA